jgi:hypothetical protein
MRLMHTKLPEFYEKVEAAGKKVNPNTEVEVRGLENVRVAKLASLRVGRIENEILELTTEDPEITKVEVVVMPRIPETSHTVVVKGVHNDGTCKKAILENIYISTPGVECELYDVNEVDDRRSSIGLPSKY